MRSDEPERSTARRQEDSAIANEQQDAVSVAGSDGPCLAAQERYWQRRLAGDVPILDACLDGIRPPTKAYHREELSICFSESTTERIHELCRQRGCSLLVLLLVGAKAVWVRHGAEESLVIGSATVSSRSGSSGEEGPSYTNIVPLCTDLSGNPTVAECLERAATAVREARQNSGFPFARMIPLSGYDLASPRSPIFQTMLLAFELSERWTSADTAPRREEIAEHTAACDAVLVASHSDRRLTISCEYDSELFREDTIRRYLSHLRIVVEGMLESQERRLLDLPMLDHEEEALVLLGWNQTQVPAPLDRTFVELFQERVAEHPDAICAQMGEEQLTYDQLNRSANRVAHALRAVGVGPEQLVAVLDERGLNLLVVILGVWKAGAAYVPLDPRHPSKRLAAILEGSRASVAVTGRTLAPLLHEAGSQLSREARPRVLVAEEVLRGSTMADNLDVVAEPGCLAYTIFTSGSTGTPKGAMVEQRGMINHLYAKIRELELGPRDIVAETASQCFDISVWQFMAPLLSGGRVHVVEDAVAYDPMRLLEIVARYRITVLQTVPSFLHVVLGEPCARALPLGHLRWLISTGEALPPELCERWFHRYAEIPLLNAYGPTECSDDVTHHVLDGRVQGASVPIGRPLANTQIYVVDEQLRPQPVGVRGELLVGGVGVGRGYCGSPDLTAEAFVPSPFSEHAGARLYRTRDSARWASNGQLEYLGRLDHQLKVRGFRIEPREIEVVLRHFAEVQDAVVMPRDEGDGNVTLIAYLVSSRPPRIADLDGFVRARLPVYMLPAAYVVLDRFPRTTNGKIDRRALPAPTPGDRPTSDDYEAPRGATEAALVEKWAELFDLERVGRHDNFLDLGGHSLLATQLVSWIYEVFQLKLSLRDVFEAPSVERLAERIDALRGAVEPAPSPGGVDEEEIVL
ncbi:amino acid adenylation domain-containing protein [Sorangium sp. So ce321]|uniref:non-ribosomal peptide synthetase n=1 Tax=Sorangium sp. So ce321 TaxID=3133300 RepID=UPI003F615353